MASHETAGTECPVCREEYKTPKLLPCAHTLCRDCLLSWLRDRGCQATCPLCRELILPTATANDLGNDDLDLAVDALPTDHAAAAVAEGHRVLKGPHVCCACIDSDGNGQVASSFCFHCNMKLCQQCTTAHSKFPAFKPHVTERLSVLTPQRLAVAGQVTCRSHADRSVDLYCHAHREVICTLCVPRHAECGDVNILSDCAREERLGLKSQAHRLMECGAAMAERIKRLEEERDCGQDMFNALSKDVKEKFDDLLATLEQRRRELNDVIGSQRSEFLQLKASQLTPLNELSTLVTSHGHAALRLAGSAPDGKLVDTLNALSARLSDLEAKARSTETDVATSRTRDTPPENQPPRRSERATDGVDLATVESVVLDGSAVSRAKSDIFSIRLIPDTATTRRLDPLQDSENAGVGNFDTTPPADGASKTADGISSRVYSSPQSTGSEKTVPVDDFTRSTHIAPTAGGVSQDTAAAENDAKLDVSASAPDVTTVTSDVASSCPVRKDSALAAVSSHLLSLVCDHFDKRDKGGMVQMPSERRQGKEQSVPGTNEVDSDTPETSEPSSRDASAEPMKGEQSRCPRSQKVDRQSLLSDVNQSHDLRDLRHRSLSVSPCREHFDSSSDDDDVSGARRLSLDSAFLIERDNLLNSLLDKETTSTRRTRSTSEVQTVSSVVGKESRDRAAEGNPGPDEKILWSSVPDMAIIISVGTRVTRGRNWSFFNENLDGGPGGRGRVLRVGRGSRRFGRGWVLVEWEATGRFKWHRMGAEGCYDLELV